MNEETRGLCAIPTQYNWIQPFLPTMALIPMRLSLTFQGDDENFAEIGVAIKIGGKYNHHYFELSHEYIN